VSEIVGLVKQLGKVYSSKYTSCWTTPNVGRVFKVAQFFFGLFEVNVFPWTPTLSKWMVGSWDMLEKLNVVHLKTVS
jgi:hypothetical protein